MFKENLCFICSTHNTAVSCVYGTRVFKDDVCQCCSTHNTAVLCV